MSVNNEIPFSAKELLCIARHFDLWVPSIIPS